MQVAEIAVRFGEASDGFLDVRHLARGTYRIGNGRDVDLALLGLTSFPLVDWIDRPRCERGCMFRVPAGMAARRIVDGTVIPLEGGLLLARGDRVELSIGAIEVVVELVQPTVIVPKPRFDAAFARWVAAALVAHLIALFVIDLLADPEPEGIRLVSLVSLLPQLPEPPPSTDTQARTFHRREANKKVEPRIAAVEPEPESIGRAAIGPAAIEADPAPTPAKRRARAIEGARRAGILGGRFTAEDIRAITGSKDIAKELEGVGPIYRDYEAEQNGFGGGRRFDPTKREGWGTVATGRYATVSGGRAAGEHYSLPGEVEARRVAKVSHCVGSCTATGGLTRDAVRSAIARHDEAILGCYERGGQVSRGDVVIEISIEDGKVITADGAGLGTTGSCVAGVIRRVAFPKAPATTVRYPLSFSPS